MIQDCRKLLKTAGIGAPLVMAGMGARVATRDQHLPADVHARAKSICAMAGYRGQPLLINEDDHFDFDRPESNMMAAIDEYCGWGFSDYRQIREPFECGYQSLPLDWAINSPARKAYSACWRK